MAAFTHFYNNIVVSKKKKKISGFYRDVWPSKPKIFTIFPLKTKFAKAYLFFERRSKSPAYTQGKRKHPGGVNHSGQVTIYICYLEFFMKEHLSLSLNSFFQSFISIIKGSDIYQSTWVKIQHCCYPFCFSNCACCYHWKHFRVGFTVNFEMPLF